MASTSGQAAGPARAPGAGEVSAEDVAAVAKALGHPARVHIVRLLLEKRSCIGGDIVEEVGLAQSTVSEHLRILKSAGVIRGEIERPRVCYSLDPDSLVPLAHLLDAVLDAHRRGELGGPGCYAPPEGGRARPAGA